MPPSSYVKCEQHAATMNSQLYVCSYIVSLCRVPTVVYKLYQGLYPYFKKNDEQNGLVTARITTL